MPYRIRLNATGSARLIAVSEEEHTVSTVKAGAMQVGAATEHDLLCLRKFPEGQQCVLGFLFHSEIWYSMYMRTRRLWLIPMDAFAICLFFRGYSRRLPALTRRTQEQPFLRVHDFGEKS